jgi:hypothetical protein
MSTSAWAPEPIWQPSLSILGTDPDRGELLLGIFRNCSLLSRQRGQTLIRMGTDPNSKIRKKRGSFGFRVAATLQGGVIRSSQALLAAGRPRRHGLTVGIM